MIQTADFRDINLQDIPDVIQAVVVMRRDIPDLGSIIISPTQREALVESDPFMYRRCLKLSREFGRPIREIDFVMIIEGCRVEVE